jgi:hypothetical protein
MKLIALSKTGKYKGKYFAQVDDEDYEFLNQFAWSVQIAKRTQYAMRAIYPNGKKGGCKSIYMHRLILNVSDTNIEVDHIDHNGLNCKKNNLRKTTQKENMQNRLSRIGSTSKFVGVMKVKNRNLWQSILYKDGKRVFRKTFKSELDAALARDEAVLKYKGEFGYLNKPTIDKTAIKAAIKAGEEVAGARIITNQNLQLK